jgi:hypothetical protein
VWMQHPMASWPCCSSKTLTVCLPSCTGSMSRDTWWWLWLHPGKWHLQPCVLNLPLPPKDDTETWTGSSSVPQTTGTGEKLRKILDCVLLLQASF